MVKLKSGKEVELRGLTFFEKQVIKDIAYTYSREKIFPIMTSWTKALSFMILEKELETWTDKEIAEAGNWVIENSNLTEIQKKS